ncbi:MAG: ferritin-like fold-containing protein [Actinomycetaceae bacterium]|nr:ferritin-like fold-containing protein [Actinomycetaceae bacterium]
MTDESTGSPVNQLLGLSAYAAVSAQARLAKDADQAPKTFEHIDMARMSGQAWKIFERIEKRAQVSDVDLLNEVRRYEGILDDLDARTRPTTWWERLTKTYVTVGIFTDALREVARAVGENELAEEVTDFGHGEWVRNRLAPYTNDDEQLRARLSLWTRRVGGEALGLVRAFMFTNPELAGSADPDALMERLSHAHKQRLADINLLA